MRKVFAIAILLFVFAGKKSYATHAAGMDLSYQCSGNNIFVFKCTFYRDCGGVPAPDLMNLHITSICGFNQTYDMDLIYSTQGTDSIAHLAGLCPNQTSLCTGGISQGYEQYVYEAIVTLSPLCTDYTCGVGIAARNNGITNLQDPGMHDLYVENHLSTVNLVCNNSPVFSTIPLSYGCVNQYWTYNHGGYDPDGDSLVYTLVNPLDDAGSNIQYSSGSYSATHPFSMNGNFDFDPITGQMGATANAIQIVVISVRVDEYRYGVKIGSAQRDLQVVFQACTNNVPSIPFGIFTAIGGTVIDSSTVSVCPGSLLTFYLVGNDFDVTQTLNFTSNISQVIPDAVFTSTSGNPVLGTISWQTPTADIGTYTFTVTVIDDACPFSGQGVYSFTIIVEPSPISLPPDTTLCSNEFPYQLNVTGQPPYLWSNGQYLNDSTIQNPVATLPGTGTYVFVATVEAGTFCENSDSIIVIVANEIPVTATALPDSICPGDLVILKATTNVIGDFTYEWNSIPPGFTSILQNTYDNPDSTTTYIVTLTNGSCEYHDTVTVNVVSTPTPSITVVPSSTCENVPVTVTYTGSSDSSTVFTWDFGGGTVLSGSGSGPYVISFPNADSTTISLTVSEGGLCPKTTSASLVVGSYPIASFHSDTSGCEPFNVTFQNTSINASSYVWNFGDGDTSTQANPSHDFNAGDYTVTLIATSATGCSDTTIYPFYIHVNPKPDATFTVVPSAVCANEPVTITYTGNGSPTSNYTWTFGNGSVISGSGTGPYVVEWSDTNSTTVTLFVTDSLGCTNSASINVTVNALPVASFSSNITHGCTPAGVDFFDLSAGSPNDWSWNFGDGDSSALQNPYHVYGDSGSYDVTLIVTTPAGCADTTTIEDYIKIDPSPVVTLSVVPQALCANLPSIISYTGNSGTNYTYTWDFGGGTVLNGSGSGPYEVEWSSGGNTTVSLTVTDTVTGCSTTDFAGVTVYDLPVAAFSANSIGCDPLTVSFQNNSIGAVSYDWVLGNGNISGLLNPVEQYTTGTYDVTLIVTSAEGCMDTLTLDDYVVVSPTPSANFTVVPAEVCANAPVSITYTGGNLAGVSYNWNFSGGDILSGSGYGPYAISWSNSGSQTVTLVVTDTSSGCSAAQSFTVLVDPLPIASFIADSEGCAPLTVSFQNTSAGATSYYWDFGDGTNSTQPNPVNVYPEGTYTVTLIATSAAGCSDTITLNNFIGASNPPEASFTIVPNEVCAGQSVEINYTGNSTNISFSWNFAGGNILSGTGGGPYSVDWQTAGNYTITLTVTDSNTCENTSTQSVTVNPNPVASFTANTEGCNPFNVQFENTSQLGDNFNWDFGNGNSSMQENPGETYSTGTYDVTLIVTTDAGCADTLTANDYIVVVPYPVAAFTIVEPYNMDVDVSQATYHFINESQNATSYFWDFGDGTSSTDENPEHHYSSLDTFVVTLIACNDYCCDTIVIGKIIVVNYNHIFFPDAFSPNGDGLNDFFHELGTIGTQSIHFSIYNRWGEMVFEGHDVNAKWDGSFKGKNLEVGVYDWFASAVMINGNRLTAKGNVTIVR